MNSPTTMKPPAKTNNPHQCQFSLHDDNVYHIMTFLELNFIIGTCMMVSKQWNEQARKVPIKLSLHSVNNNPFVHLNLTDLEVGGPKMNEFCDWIIDSPQMIHLTALKIRGEFMSPLGDESCERVANCPHLSNLTCLKLPMNEIGNDGCKSIINSLYLTKLRELDLSFNIFTGKALKEMENSSVMTNLTSLSLAGLYYTTSIQSLLTNANMCNLKKLDLSNLNYNYIRKLEAGSNLCNLTRLNLNNNRMKINTTTTVMQNKFPKLKYLDLSFNEINDEQL